MVASGSLFFIAPRWLIGLFTTDAAVLALGTSLLYIAAVFQLFDASRAWPRARCAAWATRARP